jgi:hypothetical protein
MAKKKSTKTARPKKLRLVTNSPIGLTDEQQKELRKIYRPLSHVGDAHVSFDNRTEQKRISLNRFLYIYIEALCSDAMAENADVGKRRATSIRRDIVKNLKSVLGYDPSPTDIVRELSKYAPVPDYAKDAIRRDYLRVTV